MHEKVLSEQQRALLPLLAKFSEGFGLVGGTAVALQLGHRKSIDFDLLALDNLDQNRLIEMIKQKNRMESTLVDLTNEFTVVVDGVKVTFLKYPFRVEFTKNLKEMIKMPDLLSLASMKAYALGRRAKWKDYVDLYFIFQNHNLKELIDKAKEIFRAEFNEKLFREQLTYFEDVDRSETIDYVPGYEIEDRVIEDGLKEISLQRD